MVRISLVPKRLARRALGDVAPHASRVRDMRGRGLAAAALLSWSVVVAAPRAALAEPSAESRALHALFDEADKAEGQGHYAEALSKFQLVLQARPTPGVRFHLANCEEHLGQLVSALENFKTARDQATSQSAADVLRAVEGRIPALEKRIPQVTLNVPPDVDGATVTMQGREVPRALWGAPIPGRPRRAGHRRERAGARRLLGLAEGRRGSARRGHHGDAREAHPHLATTTSSSAAAPTAAASTAPAPACSGVFGEPRAHGGDSDHGGRRRARGLGCRRVPGRRREPR